MDEIILHHYPLSHFSEKIRRILAYKRLPWRSAEQPMMMPKAELTALTGGYRRLPVLQIGADVYCDSSCIARRLEALAPTPACLPTETAPFAALVEEWADHRFALQMALPVIVEMMPHLPPEIFADRAAMSPLLSREAILRAAPQALTQARLSLDRLDGMLGDGRPFLLGGAFSIADAACFFPIWFARDSQEVFPEVARRSRVAAWFRRIREFDGDAPRPMSPAEALEVASSMRPRDREGTGGDGRSDGCVLGRRVAITADDYGQEATTGTIAYASSDEITILRRDETLGDIAVHFPRSGYRVADA